VPKLIVFAEARNLPMTASGKVQKFRLLRDVQALVAEGSANVPSATASTRTGS